MDFKELLTEAGGLWEYSGGRYLAQLASGKLSSLFCNTGVITTNPGSLAMATGVLADRLSDVPGFDDVSNLSVIGPGMGGITLSFELAGQLYTYHKSREIRAFFTEPVEVERNGKKEKDQKFRFDLPPGKILFVEDVITTGGSVEKTMRAVLVERPERIEDIIPFVLCLVDRRGADDKLVLRPRESATIECEVISLLKLSPRTWDTLELAQKDCPNVVEALRPKANWKKLVEG